MSSLLGRSKTQEKVKEVLSKYILWEGLLVLMFISRFDFLNFPLSDEKLVLLIAMLTMYGIYLAFYQFVIQTNYGKAYGVSRARYIIDSKSINKVMHTGGFKLIWIYYLIFSLVRDDSLLKILEVHVLKLNTLEMQALLQASKMNILVWSYRFYSVCFSMLVLVFILVFFESLVVLISYKNIKHGLAGGIVDHQILDGVSEDYADYYVKMKKKDTINDYKISLAYYLEGLDDEEACQLIEKIIYKVINLYDFKKSSISGHKNYTKNQALKLQVDFLKTSIQLVSENAPDWKVYRPLFKAALNFVSGLKEIEDNDLGKIIEGDIEEELYKLILPSFISLDGMSRDFYKDIELKVSNITSRVYKNKAVPKVLNRVQESIIPSILKWIKNQPEDIEILCYASKQKLINKDYRFLIFNNIKDFPYNEENRKFVGLIFSLEDRRDVLLFIFYKLFSKNGHNSWFHDVSVLKELYLGTRGIEFSSSDIDYICKVMEKSNISHCTNGDEIRKIVSIIGGTIDEKFISYAMDPGGLDYMTLIKLRSITKSEFTMVNFDKKVIESIKKRRDITSFYISYCRQLLTYRDNMKDNTIGVHHFKLIDLIKDDIDMNVLLKNLDGHVLLISDFLTPGIESIDGDHMKYLESKHFYEYLLLRCKDVEIGKILQEDRIKRKFVNRLQVEVGRCGLNVEAYLNEIYEKYNWLEWFGIELNMFRILEGVNEFVMLESRDRSPKELLASEKKEVHPIGSGLIERFIRRKINGILGSK